MADRIASFREFWPFYCREHSNPATRAIHFVGSLAGPTVAALLILRTGNPWFFFVYPLIAYGAAWGSHFLIEHNKPATFQYPLWSLIADYKMVGMMLAGRMSDEVRRAFGR